MCSAAKSTHRTCQSDEPFTIRDIQFDNPQIGVPAGPPGQLIVKFGFIFRILNGGAVPDPAALRVGHTLKKPRVCALFGQDDKDCPGFAFTFANHRRKAAGGLDRADQARHLEVGGQAGAQAASFSIEWASSA